MAWRSRWPTIRPTRRSTARLHRPAGDAADRDQPALGARRDAQRCWRRCRRPSGADGRLPARRRDLPTRTSRSAARIGEHGLAADPAGSSRKRRARQHPDPLQRRLARHRRLGHRARADLPGARCRHPGPRLGRRDPAAQPGRQPHRLGARPARRAAHGDRRQCRRPSDAARPGRPLHRRHRPHDARAATSATRSAPT